MGGQYFSIVSLRSWRYGAREIKFWSLPILFAASPLSCRLRRQDFISRALTIPPATHIVTQAIVSYFRSGLQAHCTMGLRRPGCSCCSSFVASMAVVAFYKYLHHRVVQFVWKSHSVTNKSDSAGQSFNFVITRMITDRIGVHSVLPPGHQKEAVHSLNKNPSKRKKCENKHREFHRMGGGKMGI